MSDGLQRHLVEELDRITPPPGDLEAVRRRGTRIRRRRTALTVTAVAAVLVAVVAGGSTLLSRPVETVRDRTPEPVGQMDFSEGLRAFADPGGRLYIGGRWISAEGLGTLDTDGTTSPAGVVYYLDGVPMLLAESGESRTLEEAAEPAAGGFHPTAKADRDGAAAYGAVVDGEHQVVARDLATGAELGRLPVTEDTVIDAFDDGVVFLRDDEGTTAWDTRSGEREEVAGPEIRVADVPNGVLLHATGAEKDDDPPVLDRPAADDYRLVRGAIDAQLTFDGRHVLYWSSRLAPTRPNGDPIRLQRGPVSGYAFWAMDADGSVLVAAPQQQGRFAVYDCEVPSGECDTVVDDVRFTGGDPMFIGVDM